MQDLLRRLPGVTSANFRAIINGVGSLCELAGMSKTALSSLIGLQNASLLYDFMHRRGDSESLRDGDESRRIEDGYDEECGPDGF